MTGEIRTVLAVGATGSIGRLVVQELLDAGLEVRALVRDVGRARRALPSGIGLVGGDLTRPETLAAAVDGVDGIVLTHGGAPYELDYVGVRNLLEALDGRMPRIALMTSMSVSQRRTGVYAATGDWKRAAERLVRAYGAPYTIVRPGWFDYQAAHERAVLLEQGDDSPVDSHRGVARTQIARTLVQSLLAATATNKTFELFAQDGEAPSDWSAVFAPLVLDDPATLAGGLDRGVALADEPAEVRADIDRLRAR